MNSQIKRLIRLLEETHGLSDEQFALLLTAEDHQLSAYLAERARAVREKYYGRSV